MLETWFLKDEVNDIPGLTEEERDEDLSAVWVRLETGLEKPVKRFRVLNYAAAAAILLVASSVLFLYLYKSPVATVAGSTYVNDVPSGKNKAFLTLGDGRRVSLDDAVNGNVIQQEGAVITKTRDGQLVYNAGDQKNGDNSSVPNTIETPQGGQWQVNLPDGTKVWLNSASKLTYPSSFSGLKTRSVMLSGEGYFEVAHDRSKPFIIVTDKQVAEVLGTHFNINSYGDEPAIKTTLLEGSIKVTVNKKFEILKPGQEAAASEKINVTNVDTDNAVAWKNGDFNFGQNDFRTTMRQLARWYNVEIVYDDSAPGDVKLHGWISRSKSVVSVLKVMELTGEVHFKVKGRRIVVTK
ncbi:FecR family protein [Pedobacter sp. NJ-S-72]